MSWDHTGNCYREVRNSYPKQQLRSPNATRDRQRCDPRCTGAHEQHPCGMERLTDGHNVVDHDDRSTSQARRV